MTVLYPLRSWARSIYYRENCKLTYLSKLVDHTATSCAWIWLGSYTKKSYTAKEIDPYRKKAMKWLKDNQSDPTVAGAIKGIEGLYRSAGPLVEAYILRGMTPQERARVAWSRLREAKVDPLKPLAAWLAIEMIFLADPQRENKQHFKRVQAAKIVHRLASGSHKRWEITGYDGKPRVTELHKYPRSRGRVLVHMGQQLERVAEFTVECYFKAYISFASI